MNYIDDCFGSFAKISLKDTTFSRWYTDYVEYDLGINIDLFVLDNIPDNCIVGGIPAKIISRKMENVVKNI